MFIAPLLICIILAVLFPRAIKFILVLIAFGVLFVVASCIDHANAADSADIVRGLGPVLAAENACGLKYDQTAIAAFIRKNVDPTDANFTNVLNYMTDTTNASVEKMTASSKQAFCIQETRVAESYGFISSGSK